MAEEWKPPDENAFNHEWLRPGTAVEMIDGVYSDEPNLVDIGWILAYLDVVAWAHYVTSGR